MASLDGKVALVTGGARGIGAETARLLIARGARVALLDLDGEQLAATAAELGPSAVPFVADVTDTAGLEQAVGAAVRELGGIDIALVNAGVATFGTVRTIDPAAFEGTVEINLLGAWRTIRACLPHVVERRGYVLVVASMAAILQAPGMGAYSASKAGVEALANSLRLEVRHLGVDVGVAYYTWIGTQMVRFADEEQPGFGRLRSRLKGPLARTYPPEVAAAATAAGIERRAKKVFVPRWLGLISALRGMLGPAAGADRRGIEQVVTTGEADAQRRGAAEASAQHDAAGRATLEAGRRRAGG